MFQLVVRSFGLGIMMVDVVTSEPAEGRDLEARRAVENMFVDAQEWVSDPAVPGRALLMAGSGHVPTRFELAQVSDDDWAWMRRAVDESGTGGFSERLAMLEGCRGASLQDCSQKAC